MVISAAVLCLALNIFHESRGETVPGQYAVALVTLNRAGGDKGKVCEEVFKSRQFSWTSGVKRTKKGWSIPARMLPRDDEAWARADRIATVTLQGRMADITHGATFYHAKSVHPSWRHAFERTKQIGAHLFYRLRSQP